MKITMSRKIQTASYESADITIEMDGDDAVEMQHKALKAVLKWELLYEHITVEEAAERLARFKRIHRIDGESLSS